MVAYTLNSFSSRPLPGWHFRFVNLPSKDLPPYLKGLWKAWTLDKVRNVKPCDTKAKSIHPLASLFRGDAGHVFVKQMLSLERL